MTTAESLSLPWRVHDTRPADQAGIMEHAVEALAGLYAEARCDRAAGTAEAILDCLHRFRGDLSVGRLRDAVEDLCRLSAEVGGFELRGQSHTPGCRAAEDEYSAALTALATEPAVA